MIFWSTFLSFFQEFIIRPPVNTQRALKKFPHDFLNLPGRGQKCWTISLSLAQKDVQLGNRQNAGLAAFIHPPWDPLPPDAELLGSSREAVPAQGRGSAQEKGTVCSSPLWEGYRSVLACALTFLHLNWKSVLYEFTPRNFSPIHKTIFLLGLIWVHGLFFF